MNLYVNFVLMKNKIYRNIIFTFSIHRVGDRGIVAKSIKLTFGLIPLVKVLTPLSLQIYIK